MHMYVFSFTALCGPRIFQAIGLGPRPASRALGGLPEVRRSDVRLLEAAPWLEDRVCQRVDMGACRDVQGVHVVFI